MTPQREEGPDFHFNPGSQCSPTNVKVWARSPGQDQDAGARTSAAQSYSPVRTPAVGSGRSACACIHSNHHIAATAVTGGVHQSSCTFWVTYHIAIYGEHAGHADTTSHTRMAARAFPPLPPSLPGISGLPSAERAASAGRACWSSWSFRLFMRQGSGVPAAS